ncbi:hypothetical protein Tco_0091652 [Tanacetum coccineum]
MWIITSRNGRLIWIYLKIERSRSSSSSFLCFFTLDGKGRFDDLEVWLADVGFEGVGKWGSQVLTPDLVVMAKVGASGLGVLLFPIAKRIYENCLCISLRCWSSISPIPFVWDFFLSIKLASSYRRSNRTSEGKDHRRCLPPGTSIPAQLGCSACSHRPRMILRSSRKLGCIPSEMEETFMDGDSSSHISSWYWTPQ